MSNQQWNTGQGEQWPPQQPEGGAHEQPTTQHDWGQQADWTQQGQTSASEWGQPQQPAAAQDWQQAPQQPAANDWQQAHPQPSAGDWHQAQPQQSAQDWNQQGWNQPQQQNWDQQAQQAWEQQQWQGQQAAPQGPGQFPAGGGYAGPWQGGSPVPVAKKPSPFDFGFKSGSLPGTAGTIFLVGTIGIGVWWLFEVIAALTYVFEFPLDFFFALIGEGGLALFAVMLLRAVLEVGVAAVGLLNKPDSTKADADDTTSV